MGLFEERAAELARIEELLDRVTPDGGRLLALVGPAGIGKTTLLAAALERSRARELQILRARAGELEREFAFGVVRQLFEPALATRSDPEALFAGAAALARPLFSVADGPDPLVGERAHTALHGLFWLTANLAAERPLVVAVDDLPWCDGASRRWLHYLAARLEDLPIMLLVTERTGDPLERAARPLARDVSDGRAESIELPPLSEAAAARVVRSALGRRADAGFCAACHTATGGNPFLLRALVDEMASRGITPGPGSAPLVAAAGPGAVQESVIARLERLGADAVRLAHAASILGTQAQLRHAAKLAELGEDSAASAADALAAAGIVDGRPLEFTHPLVRSAVYESITPARRALAHRRAADLLTADQDDPAHAAGHLLLSEPAGDRGVVATLRVAARCAMRAGAPAAAASYLRRALAEPPARADRPEVLHELGFAGLLGGDHDALGHLRDALALAPDPQVGARRTMLVAQALTHAGRPQDALGIVDRALGAGGPADRELRLRLEAWRIRHGSIHANYATACHDRAAALLDTAGSDTAAERELTLALAFNLAMRGAPGRTVRALLDSGRAGAQPGEWLFSMGGTQVVAAALLADELDLADALLEEMLALASFGGVVALHNAALALRAWVALRRGRLATAASEAQASLELALANHQGYAATFSRTFAAMAAVASGELGEAERWLREVGLDQFEDSTIALNLDETRGRLALANGDLAAAAEHFIACGERCEALGVRHPSVVPWRALLALAIAGADPERARAAVEEELVLAREASHARGIGISLRTRGVLGCGVDPERDLREAVDVLAATPAELEYAGSLVELGSWLRRNRQSTAAREPLGRARELAHRCGALTLGRRADAELRATGARPRRLAVTGADALTPSELRVAELAASGLSNPVIAQQLFVTVNTVESHLRHAYRKLDIHSREQLPGMLAVS